MLHFRSKPLPEPAERYLVYVATSRSPNTINLYRASLHHFFRFLAQIKLALEFTTARHLQEFDEDLERHCLKFVTRKATLSHVRIFIQWLEDQQELPQGTAKRLFPDYRGENIFALQANLPALAERFLEVLRASSKPNTVSGYRSGLRGFYRLH